MEDELAFAIGGVAHYGDVSSLMEDVRDFDIGFGTVEGPIDDATRERGGRGGDEKCKQYHEEGEMRIDAQAWHRIMTTSAGSTG